MSKVYLPRSLKERIVNYGWTVDWQYEKPDELVQYTFTSLQVNPPYAIKITVPVAHLKTTKDVMWQLAVCLCKYLADYNALDDMNFWQYIEGLDEDASYEFASDMKEEIRGLELMVETHAISL
jgi:hypothetical protein